MVYRALRLFIIGFLGVAAAAATAGELTPAQRQTIAIPKRVNPTSQPASYNGLKVGNGLQIADTPFAPGRVTPISPLSGLSLDNVPAAPPPASAAASDTSPSAVTQQNGNILYSVAPGAGFTPFIGIGAGRAAGLLTSSDQSHRTPYDTGDALHSYQGLAGFDYKLDKDTHLDFAYRMSNTQRPTVPVMDNADIADSGRDRAAILSLHYDLDPILKRPHE